MIGSFFGEGIRIHKLFREVICESFPAEKDVASGRTFGHWNFERFLNRVDSVLGHGSVRGPFATHDADQTAGWIDFDDVVTSDLLGALIFTRADQRSRARESTDDFAGRYRPFEVLIQLPEHEIDIRTAQEKLVPRGDFLFRC